MLWTRLSQTFSKHRTQPQELAFLAKRQPQTLISGTTILDSGFLSNIRVIRSFKSSAMSGLGVTTVKGRSKKTQET